LFSISDTPQQLLMGVRGAVVVLAVCLLAAAQQAAGPCHVATRDGQPCPTHTTLSLREYLASSGGALPFSYSASMDATEFLQQQVLHTHEPGTTPAPVPRTPSPTPHGVHYFKDCSHVSCKWIHDHVVEVRHSHLEKHGPYHRYLGLRVSSRVVAPAAPDNEAVTRRLTTVIAVVPQV
jgi:hypothetical protein